MKPKSKRQLEREHTSAVYSRRHTQAIVASWRRALRAAQKAEDKAWAALMGTESK